jgi:hypothetical protein
MVPIFAVLAAIALTPLVLYLGTVRHDLMTTAA